MVSAFSILHYPFLIHARRVKRGSFRLQCTQGQSGQALVESCIVIMLLGLIMTGLFQLSQLMAAKEISAHACFRGARAKTVGFNDFMTMKSVLVGAIGNAGNMIFPETRGGPAAQMAAERGLIPTFLSSEGYMLDGILQYEDWENIYFGYDDLSSLRFWVSQDMPIRYFPAMFRAFYSDDIMPINTEIFMDNHASLYLE